MNSIPSIEQFIRAAEVTGTVTDSGGGGKVTFKK